jgi:hypothetical protein
MHSIDLRRGVRCLARCVCGTYKSVFLLAAVLAGGNALGISVPTAQYSNSRTNANTQENILNQSNVTAGRFGLLGSWSIDGFAYAQPILVENACGVSLCLIAATMHNSIYAFDANSPQNSPIWHVNTGTSMTSYPGISDGFSYMAEIGCLATPVVSQSLGVVYETCVSSSGVWSLYSFNLADGSQFKSSVAIAGTSNSLTFSTTRHLQRSALLLSGSNIYFAFTGFADTTPYQGWVFSYNASTLAFNAAWCDVNGSNSQAGIWMAGGGLAADGSGNVYLITGNGAWTGTNNYGESFVELSSSLSVSDFATPSNWATLNMNDTDLGSGRIMLIGSFVLGGGKDGRFWLLNQGMMGHLQGGGGNPPIAQVFNAVDTGTGEGNGIWGGQAFGDNTLFVSGWDDKIYSYAFNGSTFSTSPSASTSATFKYPGATLSYTSNGSDSSTGIVWGVTVAADANHSAQTGTLRAFNSTTLAELWNASVGTYAKFSQPVVANGKVFLSTFSNQIQCYGLISETGIVHTKTGGGIQ